jgi:simple sugar transport system permease protein
MITGPGERGVTGPTDPVDGPPGEEKLVRGRGGPGSSDGPFGLLDTRRGRLWLGLLLMLVLLSGVRVLLGKGGEDLTSAGTFSAALGLTIPILLAGLGGLYAERSGIVNIGLEGMMVLGTWFGAYAGWKFGPWWGVWFGVFGGGLGGLLHAVATVTFGIDQIISGVAINIMAAGATRFLSAVVYANPATGGSASQSPQVNGSVGSISLPFLAGGTLFGWKSPDLFGWLNAHHWFLISDAAGILKGVTAGLSWLTVITLLLIPATYFLLWRTTFGLRLRSVGEHPLAAESLGIPVYRMKYIAVTISGCLAGLGGAVLVLDYAGIYREGQTGGRGFIGLAAVIFGNWRPGGVGAAAALFGYANALQLRSDQAVHGLLLFVAVILGLTAAWMLLRPKRRSRWGLAVALVAIGIFAWWATSSSVPTQFVSFTPQLITLLVLAFAPTHLRPPAADGKPYRRGQAQ